MNSYIVVIYVVRCLDRADWSITKEQVAVVLYESEDDFLRLFIDIAARSQTERIALMTHEQLLTDLES